MSLYGNYDPPPQSRCSGPCVRCGCATYTAFGKRHCTNPKCGLEGSCL